MRMRGYEPQKEHRAHAADLTKTAPTQSPSVTTPIHQTGDFTNRLHCNSPSGSVNDCRQYASVRFPQPPSATPSLSQQPAFPSGVCPENRYSVPNGVSDASADRCRGFSSLSASGIGRLATSNVPRRWHNHGKMHILTRDIMRPPKYGGHSKRDQLGSVSESWGNIPGDQPRVGLFQSLPEPISPSSSPPPQTVNCAPRPSVNEGLPRSSVHEELPWPSHEELKEIKAQALERARAGTKMAKQPQQ